jgi:hypothetical protein
MRIGMQDVLFFLKKEPKTLALRGLFIVDCFFEQKRFDH